MILDWLGPILADPWAVARAGGAVIAFLVAGLYFGVALSALR